MGLRPAKAAETVRLVALGDSLTAGYGLARPDGFAPKLEKALQAGGRSVTVANAGVSGDTASGGADRVDWSVPEGSHGVIVELGANDMLRGVDPKVTRAALERLLDRLQTRRIPAMLAGMRAAPNLGPDYRQAFDRIYPDLARERGLLLYPFFLEGVLGDRTLNLQDGLHPTAKGVEAIVAGILPSVERFLDQIAAARS
ncbi:arylesterase [Hansschlegelia zhihuaiae]|uniref:Arylesterase n=1 Tax=Hansschlegelia zhihuaiae TaxID=405005 RepID=A0A4Q0M8Y1_9HYPH|nr:arylesterase [Hansschlegelia zhihuaiae]RXF69617.1 arylesterase [Hansschlegelia zhihuaiae]